MSLSTRRIALLALLFVLHTALAAPLLAQPGGGSRPDDRPGNPPDPRPLWQPPDNAATLSDFIPPGAAVRTVQVERPQPRPFSELGPLPTLPDTPGADNRGGGRSQAVAINANTTTALAINDDMMLVIEEGTFSEPVSLEIEIVQIGIPDPTETPTETVPSPIDDNPNRPIQLRPETNRILMQFQLHARRPDSGDLIPAFNRPIRLVADLRQQGLSVDAAGGYFYFAFEDEDDPGQWQEQDTRTYLADGLFTTETTHFSNWIAGWRPEAWALEWQPPAVAEFNGSATYNYPIELPPGRAGLQPSVGLAYNSSALGGAIRNVSYGTVATGWTLSDINITRTGIKTEASYITYPDTFRLVIGGAGYRLIVGGAEDGGTRYYVEDAPHIRVRNYNGTRYGSGTTNNYWVVTLPDGTQYRLGYTADAIGIQQPWFNSSPKDIEIISWHVDTVTDVSGNQMTYSYTRPARSEHFAYWCPWGGNCWLDIVTETPQPQNIYYNFASRIPTTSGTPVSHTVTRLTTGYASRIAFLYQEEGTRLSEIQIYHDASLTAQATPLRRYVIDAATVDVVNTSTKCDEYRPGQPYVRRITSTRVVNSIVELAWDRVGSRWVSLPATTFTYATLSHFNISGNQCFLYKYLETVTNGYGGRFEFAYTTDWRGIGSLENCSEWWKLPPNSPPCNYHDPDLGYDYWVMAVRQYDGRNQPTVIAYSYATPCYDQNGSTCKQPETDATYGGLVGFGQVTVTTSGPGIIQQPVRHVHFHQTQALLGKSSYEDSGWLSNGVFIKAGETTTTYVSDGHLNFGPGNAVRFAPVTSVINRQFQPGTTTSLSTKVTYAYSTAYQMLDGSTPTQLGQLTHISEYDDANAATPYRTTRRWYRANASGWVIRMTSEGIYETNSWNLIRRTWNYYDFLAHGSLSTQGRLTRSRQLLPISCNDIPDTLPGCSDAFLTIDANYNYDPFGNIIETTTYSDYGYQTQNLTLNPPNYNLDDILPTVAQTKTIAYDSDYHLYPVQMTDAAGHTAAAAYYGFKDAAGQVVPVDGFQVQTGLVKQITDTSGVVTQYEYDPFGRLLSVYDAASDPVFSGFGNANPWDGDPLQRYRYWDNTWNSGTIALNPAGNNPFKISSYTRPGSFSGAAGLTQLSFFDGLGRPIQTVAMNVEVTTNAPALRDLVTTTAYNAMGQVSCQTVTADVAPLAERVALGAPASGFVTDTCTNQPHTTTLYDALGQPVSVIPPDGAATTTVYGAGSVYSVNAQGQVSIADANALGQLATVAEMTPLFATSFTDANSLSNWGSWGPGTQTLSQGQLLHTDSGSADARVYRTDQLTSPDAAVIFSFRGNDDMLWFGLDAGSWTGGTYRSWNLYARGSSLKKLECTGQSCSEIELMPFTPNTWYRAMLVTSNDGDHDFRVVVWERDNPGVRAEIAVTKSDSSWHRTDWRFYLQSRDSGTQIIVDDYAEFTAVRTEYDYDRMGNLTGVTDAVGNTTTMSYDGFGRKTSMNDPDMGEWWYEYDAAGNLTQQVDNAGQQICFQYDVLNRLTHKAVDPSPTDGVCPSTLDTIGANHRATYTYFPPTAAVGSRGQVATMSWGPNPVSNRDSFSYDALARPSTQTRLIDGRSYTMQTTAYDVLGRPTQSIMPNGEVVAIGYDHEGENSLTAGGTTLVSNVQYNAMGQITELLRGNSIATTYNYFGATDVAGGGAGDSNFRLQTIQHGGAGIGDALPDFSYQYDRVGNITQMMTQNTAGTDIQTFAYDHLNRLISAAAAGNVANYTHTGANGYAYDPVGNITSANGVGYTYGDPAHVHAVTNLTNGHTFAYDANGNMISRTDDAGEYAQLFDAENRLTHVYDTQTATFSEHFSVKDTTQWVYNTYQTVPFPFAGDQTVRNSGTGNSYTANFYRKDYSLNHGDSVQLEFQLTDTNSVAHLGIETAGSYLVNYNRLVLLARNDGFEIQEIAGSSGYQYTPLLSEMDVNTWYVLTLMIDDNNGFVVRVHQKDDPSVSASYTTTAPSAGLAWRFHHWLYRGTSYLDNYHEQQATTFAYDASGIRTKTVQPGGVTTYFPFPSYEETVDGANTIRRSTYAIAGQTVALRVTGDPEAANNGLFYLYSDHLGSTSAIQKSNGTNTTINRYLPFGDYRPGSAPNDITDLGYTGQKENMELGLMYYNARYYVPYIYRWVSPDSIVPDLTNPQSLNRYSYVENRVPNFNDPTGHCIFGIDTTICVAIAIGAGVGLIVDYGTQVVNNMNEGMNFWDAANYQNINWAKVVGSSAAGGVGGGIAAPISGFAGPSLISRLAWSGTGGAIGGAVAGQTSSLVEATVQEIDSYYRGYGFVDDRLFENAADNGFLDPNDIFVDAGTGIVFAWAGDSLKSVLNSSGHLGDDALTPMIEMKPVLGEGVQTRIAMVDGRVITMNPNQFQAFMQGLANGGRDVAADLLIEWFGTQLPEE